jgi:hypothetical protein
MEEMVEDLLDAAEKYELKQLKVKKLFFMII